MKRVKRISRFGWTRDLPDQRDHLYAAPVEWLTRLPAAADLRRHCPPPYDQGTLGSCTANAIAAAIQFDRTKQGLRPSFVPSRLFIYYNERAMEGTIDSDSGAQIRDGIKSVARQGDCPEPEWPYIPSRFSRRPPASCYRDAVRHRALSYRRISRSVLQLKGCIASGFPFVFGFAVYDSFLTTGVASSGHAPMPSPSESLVGGHAVLAVGYNDRHQWFIVRNSWGSRWGMKGYFTLPYAYLGDPALSDDFWTIRTVE